MTLNRSFSDYAHHKDIIGLFSVLLVLSLLFTFLPGAFLSSGSAFLRISEIGVSFQWPVFGITLAVSGLMLLASSFLISLLMVSVIRIRYSISDADVNDRVFSAAKKMFLFFLLFFGASFGLSLLFESLAIPLHFAQLVLLVVYLPFMFALPSFAVDDYSFSESLMESTRFEYRLQIIRLTEELKPRRAIDDKFRTEMDQVVANAIALAGELETEERDIWERIQKLLDSES